MHEPAAGSHAAGGLPRGPHGEELSTREWEVLQLIAAGDSNQEIADDLFLSMNTIKTYVRTGYAKIDVTSRSQAVAWVLATERRRSAGQELPRVARSARRRRSVATPRR